MSGSMVPARVMVYQPQKTSTRDRQFPVSVLVLVWLAHLQLGRQVLHRGVVRLQELGRASRDLHSHFP